MTAYVIDLGNGLMLGLNRHPEPPNGGKTGWRPLTWTRRLVDAEKFGSPGTATGFALDNVAHDNWTARSLPETHQDDPGDCA